jgi:hypothetical protein
MQQYLDLIRDTLPELDDEDYRVLAQNGVIPAGLHLPTDP